MQRRPLCPFRTERTDGRRIRIVGHPVPIQEKAGTAPGERIDGDLYEPAQIILFDLNEKREKRTLFF